MPILTYAGIGARATPSSVLADMTVIAGWLARNGWHLATGGAEGADSAFAAGAPADRRSLWLPWPGYNGHHGPDCLALSPVRAPRLHGHRRPIAPGVGPLLPDRPQTACAQRRDPARREMRSAGRCGGLLEPGRRSATGGTGMAIRIAGAHGIPVLNLGSMSPRTVCERLDAIRRAASGS